MKIAILYDGKNNFDWSIPAFKREFQQAGVRVGLYDIHDPVLFHNPALTRERGFPQVQKLITAGFTTWINRIYPSNADRGVISKALDIISWLHARGCITINPPQACTADYDKFKAYRFMQKANVPTPDTFQITQDPDLLGCLKKIPLPCIVKRNTGGKGMGVVKVNDFDNFFTLFSKTELQSGKYIIQKFAPPVIDHDIRIVVCNGKAVAAYGRTLVKNEDCACWMGSCEHGSKIIEYKASENENSIAVAATQAIGAILNEVDMQITAEGPVIIENNPSPGCNKGGEWWITLITRHLMEFIPRE